MSNDTVYDELNSYKNLYTIRFFPRKVVKVRTCAHNQIEYKM